MEVLVTLHNKAYNPSTKGAIAKRISRAGYGTTYLSNGSFTGIVVTGKGLYYRDIKNLIADFIKRFGKDIKVKSCRL